jgi:hypothetical protein
VSLIRRYVETRRAARRAAWAVASLRLEATRARRQKERALAEYLDALADLIEETP